MLNLTKDQIMRNQVFLGLGSNLGNREEYLGKALRFIINSVGPINCFSDIYETEPWGFHNENAFLNIVIRLNTILKPEDLMIEILSIEKELGRVRDNSQYLSRTIDIDILLYGNLAIKKTGLTIPHPMIQDRKFVLVPFCDIAPELVHPVLGKTFSDLLKECQDGSKVIRYPQSCNNLFLRL